MTENKASEQQRADHWRQHNGRLLYKAEKKPVLVVDPLVIEKYRRKRAEETSPIGIKRRRSMKPRKRRRPLDDENHTGNDKPPPNPTKGENTSQTPFMGPQQRSRWPKVLHDFWRFSNYPRNPWPCHFPDANDRPFFPSYNADQPSKRTCYERWWWIGTDAEFYADFRMTKEDAEELLHLVGEKLPPIARGCRTVEEKLLITLSHYAKNDVYKELSNKHSVSESEVGHILRLISALIVELLDNSLILAPETVVNHSDARAWKDEGRRARQLANRFHCYHGLRMRHEARASIQRACVLLNHYYPQPCANQETETEENTNCAG